MKYSLPPKIVLLLALYLSCLQHTKAQCPGTLTATSTSTAASCPSQGSITINASAGIPFPGANPYEYEIIAGPAIRVQQSSNVFSGLPAGAYTVQVSDQSCSITIPVTVADTYTPMSISATVTDPTCVLTNNDGTLTVTVTGGSSPFNYNLTGPVNAMQTSAIFTNLVPGNYTVSVTDACGEIRSYNASLSPAIDYSISPFIFNGSGDLPAGQLNTSYGGVPTEIPGTCDSVRSQINTQLIPIHPLVNPIQVNLYDSITNVLITTVFSNGLSPYLYFKKGHAYRIEIYDGCNDTLKFNYNPRHKELLATAVSSCGGGAGTAVLRIYTFAQDLHNSYVISKNMTETFTIISGPNMVNTSVSNGNLQADFPGVTVGGTYQVEVDDGCQKDTITYTVPAGLPFQVDITPNWGLPCMDSTAAPLVHIQNIKQDATSLELSVISGPASFTDVHGVTHVITYPYTITDVNTNTTDHYMYLNNMPQGTYTIQVSTMVGNTICDQMTSAFTISPADLVLRHYSVDGTISCPGSNALTVNPNGQNNTQDQTIISGPNGYAASHYFLPYPFSVSGLASGAYHVIGQTLPSPYSSNNQLIPGPCGVFLDTIVDLTYRIPQVISTTGVTCSDGSVSAISVDSIANGVKPFTYAITAGPVTRPSQSSNIFMGLPSGTYSVSISDACGNTITTAITTNIISPAIINNIPPCPGSNVILTATNYPNAIYSWTGPNGFTATGNSITLNNYDPTTQGGSYTVFVTYPGCSTVSRGVTLGTCSILPVGFKSFTGIITNCKAILNWKTATEVNSDHYEIEYSTDAIRYTVIDQVHSNNNIYGSSYSYTAKNMDGYINYYRIKAVDIDGKITRSRVVLLRNNCLEKPLIKILPNPTTRMLNVSGLSGYSSIIIYDAVGQKMKQLSTTNTHITLDLINYPRGTYMLQAINDVGEIGTFKFLKQ
jgi:hypothetical protein